MREHYRILEKLGEGTFGEVRKCVYNENIKDLRSEFKQIRAVKILKKNHMEDDDLKYF